jgi:hypothetical protein
MTPEGPESLELADPATWAKAEAEVLAGLPNERPRLAEARRAHDYYELRNLKYVERRDAETDEDYKARPKRFVPFVQRVIKVLSKHLYNPGPARTIKGRDAVGKWLNQAYADVLINALWQRADRLATLGHAAAFGLAASGDPARPLKVNLWGAHEFAVWPDAGPPPTHCVTIERYDSQTQYTLWNADQYRVYRTKQFGSPDAETSGGIAPTAVGPAQPNPYRTFPFAFAHAELPISSFWEGGLGGALVHTNRGADDELSDLANAIKRYHYPLGVAENCDPSFQVIHKFGSFIRLSSILQDLENMPPAKLSYLQAQLDIEGAWHHIESSLYMTLEDLGIPRQAWRMESANAASGIALVVEQLPLLDRARERREPFRLYETDLARAALGVCGHYYGRADLVAAAADLELVLGWAEPTIPVPGPDRDDADKSALEMGLTSRVMVIMDRFGLTREQALERIKQIADDNRDADAIDPPPPQPADPNTPPTDPDSTEGPPATSPGSGPPDPESDDDYS